MKEMFYKNRLNITIACDQTDHFVFICPECNNPMEVYKTNQFGGKKDKCSYFWVKCDTCKIQGHRKIYLNDKIANCGRYCFQRTDHWCRKEDKSEGEKQ